MEKKKALAVSQVISLILLTILGSSTLAFIVVSIEQSLGAENKKNNAYVENSTYENLVLSYLGIINSEVDNKEHNVYYSHRCGEIYYTVNGTDYLVDKPFRIGKKVEGDKEYSIYFDGYTVGAKEIRHKEEDIADKNNGESSKDKAGSTIEKGNSKKSDSIGENIESIDDLSLTPVNLKECELYGNSSTWFEDNKALGDFTADIERGETVEASDMQIDEVISKICYINLQSLREGSSK